MNLDCTTPKYGELYARWLANPGKLLDLGGMKPGDRVLDLCGGTGIVSREALGRGALYVVLLDLAPRADRFQHPMFKQVRGRAEDATTLLGGRFDSPFDLVVCRQAIGYLDVRTTARTVSRLLRDNGKFVFNTFVQPRWALKSYALGGTRFVEASGYLGRTVVHIQAGLGVGLDVTKFRWHTEDDLDRALWPYFDIEKKTESRSLYYVCTRTEEADGT